MSSGKPKAVPVSELFDRLVAELHGVTLPHSVLFQAALKVCAEDSKRVQRGEAPAQLWALIERARETLEGAHPSAFPTAPPSWASSTDGESSGIRFSGLRPSAPPADAASSAPADEGAIPFEPVAPEGPAVPPAPPEEFPEFEPVPAEPAAASADDELATSVPPAIPLRTPPELGGPPPPSGPPAAPEPLSPVLRLRESSVSFQDLFPEEAGGEPAPEHGEPRSLLFRLAMVALALLAAAVAIVILWPGVAPRKPVPTRIVESFPAPRPTLASAPAPAAATAAPAQAPAVPPSPAPPQPTPQPTTAPPAPARAARVEASEGVETMRSPDWTGRPATFVVHFASYKSRDNATSDAARLGRELGRPARAVAVDLGGKGVWYRVVVGDFASAGDARAFRAEVAARKTGDVGGVYRLAAP